MPFVLVATKIDLRDDPATLARRQAPLSAEQGAELARDIGAQAYVECSALTQAGMKQVFEVALSCVQTPPPATAPRGRQLCILQ